MSSCELCHSQTKNRKRTGRRSELLCNECRYWTDYYDGFTKEDWQAEYAAMAAYEEDRLERIRRGEPE